MKTLLELFREVDQLIAECGYLLEGSRTMKDFQAGLREKLADYAHRAWSDWMKYTFSKCCQSNDLYLNYDGSLDEIIPAECANRWRRQMDTPYADLSEEEKRSDQKQADAILAIVGQALRELGAQVKALRQEHEDTAPHEGCACRMCQVLRARQ